MPVKANDIATLVEMFEASHWDELHVQVDGLHLFLSTDPNARFAASGAHQLEPATAPLTATARNASAGFAAPPEPAPKPEKEASEAPPNWVAVKAPNLGTFYRAPKPGAAPFVEVGQAVEASTEVCLLEVMKLFTTVVAGAKGIVRRVCVSDAALVEFDQTLFYIEPN
jgi:acetyl-CoA carboxylase biotin carboxyl carrier protein